MENFTPWSALLGGSLIGLAASLLFLLNGRIAGISGIFNGVLQPKAGDTAWRAWFLGGLVLGSALYVYIVPLPFALRDGYPLALLATAGFLVGVGTRMGSGCTSGHGVCGIARLSVRSLAATLTFLVTGIVTVWLITSQLGGA
jgi:uncharacterized protein